MAAPRRYPLSDHYDGRRFHNPRHHINRSWLDVLKWRRTSSATPWPAKVDFKKTAPPAPAPQDGTIRATWINHSSVLLQTRLGNLLIDPVFSERVSPLSWAGPRRVHPPGIALADIPPIDAILLSHDHYDHCDKTTLRTLAHRWPDAAFITPLGNGSIAQRCGFAPAQIIELDWWEAHELTLGLHVRATPARHWSNRVRGPRNSRLWSGFFIHAGGRTAYYSGDTAWDDEMFTQINSECGAPDLGLIPIGAYEPRWFMESQHCNPAEAVKIHQAVAAHRSLGLHWGTFQLTDEGREEPVTALDVARKQAQLPPESFVVLAPGESIEV